MPVGSFVTLMYWKGTFRLPYSSRAAEVYGQPSLPKINTFPAMCPPLR